MFGVDEVMKLKLNKLRKQKVLICIRNKTTQTSATYLMARNDDVILLARELADSNLDGSPFIFEGVYKL